MSACRGRHALRYGGRIENRSSNRHALRVNNKLYINHALGWDKFIIVEVFI